MSLIVNNVSVWNDKQEPILKNIAFTLGRKQVLALIGESGSGKTMLVKRLFSQLPIGFQTTGELSFFGQETLAYDQVGIIFQRPEQSLHPQLPIGKQFEHILLAHTNKTALQRRECMIESLQKVQLHDTETVLNAYPYQLSGGMNQRVLIAMAISMHPRLLLADEPTTALDSQTQTEIMHVLKYLVEDEQMAMLFITHDISLASFLATDVAVMKSGELIETGAIETVLKRPQQHYTKTLIAAVKTLDGSAVKC